jgi:hypothetical protein
VQRGGELAQQPRPFDMAGLDADDSLLAHPDQVGERLLAQPELHPALGHPRAERLLVHAGHG